MRDGPGHKEAMGSTPLCWPGLYGIPSSILLDHESIGAVGDLAGKSVLLVGDLSAERIQWFAAQGPKRLARLDLSTRVARSFGDDGGGVEVISEAGLASQRFDVIVVTPSEDVLTLPLTAPAWLVVAPDPSIAWAQADIRRQIAHLDEPVRLMASSKSWRITRPLRWLHATFRGALGARSRLGSRHGRLESDRAAFKLQKSTDHRL